MGCHSEAELTFKPDTKGPDGTFWVGNTHGGVFIRINPEPVAPSVYQGVIYYETHHEVWYQGQFQFDGELIFDPGNQAHYQGWDGETLHLTQDSFLNPLGEIQP